MLSLSWRKLCTFSLVGVCLSAAYSFAGPASSSSSSSSTATSSSSGTTLAQTPLFKQQPVKPVVMLNLSKDHQLFFKAFDDYSDLDGSEKEPAKKGLDITYKNSIVYYGYFNPDVCYKYESGIFTPDTPVSLSTKYCNSAVGASGQWRGNFLNWATMTRIDIIRKILYGGYRSTDETTSTILERQALPHDAHAFAKYYQGDDLDKVAPFSLADVGLGSTPDADLKKRGITICNVTPGLNTDYSQTVTAAPEMRVVKGNYSLWASNERWQCKWSGDVNDSEKGHNGNDPLITGIYAYENSPAMPETASNIGSLIVRVKVCDKNFRDSNTINGLLGSTYENYKNSETECVSYNGTDYKPTGVLQKHGENGLVRFGLITGSYANSKSGGVLRKAASAFTDEVDMGSATAPATGVFKKPSSGSIVNTLNLLKIYGYRYTDGTYFTGTDHKFDPAGSDGCRWQNGSFVNGQCSNWGNPQSEIYLESLRYLAGFKATTSYNSISASNKSDNDRIPGLITATWADPLASDELCAPLNVLQFNSSVSSYDGDELDALEADNSSFITSQDRDEFTDDIATAEDITNNYFFAGANGTINNQLCTAKQVTSLAAVNGTCPDAPRLAGTYDIAGLAYYAHTKGINPNRKKVTTFGIALAPAVPEISIPVPGNSVKKVTILPACRNTSTQSNCGLVDFKVIYQELNSNGTGSGKFLVNWEESEQGGDFDQDMWGYISYTINGSNISITTDVIADSTSSKVGFGYILSGTQSDGFHAHSGIHGYTNDAATDECPGNGAKPAPCETNGPVVKVEAEDYSAQNEVFTENTTDTGGGKNLGWIDTGDWMTYGNNEYKSTVEGYHTFTARVASPYSSGVIKIYNAVSNAFYGSINVPYTGGWQNWTNASVKILLPITAENAGIKFKLVAGGGNFNLNYFTVQSPNPTTKVYALNLNETSPSTAEGATLLPSPLYLAAKWGGLDTKEGQTTPPYVAKDALPDSYFYARDPSKLAGELDKAMSALVKGKGSGSAVAANSTSLNGETMLYQAKFTADNWTGSLGAYKISLKGSKDATGKLITATTINTTPEWTTDNTFPKSDTGRKIYTYNPGNPSAPGTEFLWNNLTATQKDYLKGLEGDSMGQMRLNWLRGYRGDESTGKVRSRSYLDGNGTTAEASLLGDIVNSDPVFVGATDYRFSKLPNGVSAFGASSYDAFLNWKKSRLAPSDKTKKIATLYVGANDGMLHAFNAYTGALFFSYVPNGIYPKLAKVTKPNYGLVSNPHQYLVDGNSFVSDVYMPTRGGWRTILVGSYGAGAKGIYVLDVTKPEQFNQKKTQASGEPFSTEKDNDVLFEVGAGDLPEIGYVMNTPVITPLRNGSWGVVFANGIESASGAASLLVIDINNPFKTSSSTELDVTVLPAANDGSLTGQAVMPDFTDRVADYVYAGDTLGRIWKFDLDDASPSKWGVTFKSGNTKVPLAQVVDRNGKEQFISSSPTLGLRQPYESPDGESDYKRADMIYFGTGRYWYSEDLVAKDTIQSVYAIANEYDDSDPVSYPKGKQEPIGVLSHNSSSSLFRGKVLQEKEITDQTSTLRSVASKGKTDEAVDWSTKKGWFLDFYYNNQAVAGERVISKLLLVNDRVFFPTFIPSANACDYGGSGWLMDLFAVGDKFGVKRNKSPAGIRMDSPPMALTEALPTEDGAEYVLPFTAINGEGSVIEAEKYGGNATNGRVSWRQLR